MTTLLKLLIWNFEPVSEEYIEAAMLLSDAREAYDNSCTDGNYLKFDSRYLARAGDWLVWAENTSTRDWLKEFFMSDTFASKYRAALISDRGDLVRYTVKVQCPDSFRENKTILNHLFSAMGNIGYRRLSDEIRWYADPTVQKSYTQAKKNRKKFNPPSARAPYDKMFWVKVSQSGHRTIQENPDKLRLGFGSGKLKFELAKGSNPGNKRARAAQGDDEAEGSRPATVPRRDSEHDQQEQQPEQARGLNRSLSQMSLEKVDDADDVGNRENDTVDDDDGEDVFERVTDQVEGPIITEEIPVEPETEGE